MKKLLLLFCAMFVTMAPVTDVMGIDKEEEDCDFFPMGFTPENCDQTRTVTVWIDDCRYSVPSCTRCYDGYELDPDHYEDGVDGCVQSTVVYECAAGYYGVTSDGTTGCTRCPTVAGLTGTSPSGTTKPTGCYIASGTSGSDTTGFFIYTANSYYCN